MDGPSPAVTATVPPSTHGEGMLAPIRDSVLAPFGPQSVPSPYGPSGDPLAGGVDYKRVWHSFRRRWLPATALGLLLAATAAVLTWVFLPRGFEAVAWLRVRDKSGMFAGGGRDNAEYEAYRKTQVALIKSPFVLQSALRRPGISALNAVADEEDPVGYLMRNIQVSAPMESEVVQVRLRGEDAREVTQLVNAVTTAFLNDVVNKERTERLQRRDSLDRKYKENMAEVRSTLDTFHNLARSLGTSDSSEVATERSLLLDHLGTLRAQINQAQRDLALIDAELAINDAKDRGELSLEQTVPEETVDAMLQRDPQFAELLGRLSAIEESMAYQAERSARGSSDPAVRRLESMRESMTRRLEDRKEELRPQIVAQLSLESSGRRTGGAIESPMVLKMRRGLLAKQLELATKDFDRVATEVKSLGVANADLTARKQEIEQLMKVTDQMGMQLNATEIDVSMPNRVELIEEASVPEGSDELFRTMLTVLAAGAGLVFGGGALVLFEYLRDRVSTVEEVPQEPWMP